MGDLLLPAVVGLQLMSFVLTAIVILDRSHE